MGSRPRVRDDRGIDHGAVSKRLREGAESMPPIIAREARGRAMRQLSPAPSLYRAARPARPAGVPSSGGSSASEPSDAMRKIAIRPSAATRA